MRPLSVAISARGGEQLSALCEPFQVPTRDIGCTVSAMVHGLSMIQKVLTDTGLSDPEIF